MDVHSTETVFEAGTDDGELLLRGKVETTPAGMRKMLNRLKKKIPGDEFSIEAGMESGATSFRVAKMLMEQGVKVHVYHAKEV